MLIQPIEKCCALYLEPLSLMSDNENFSRGGLKPILAAQAPDYIGNANCELQTCSKEPRLYSHSATEYISCHKWGCTIG